jgi:putative ABC transport system permease protein
VNRLSFLLSSLRHYRRSHLGVLIGAAVASAVLVGGLCVGDSVRHTLANRAAARIGAADVLLGGGERFFTEQLSEELGQLEGARTAPALLLPAVVSTPRGDRRVSDVRLLGVDQRFYGLAPQPGEVGLPAAKQALLSLELQRRMDAKVGDTLVLRVSPPSAIPRDLSLAGQDDSVALRVKVTGTLDHAHFGAFALDGTPGDPANIYVDLDWLQQELELDAKVNLALLSLQAFEAADLLDVQQRLDAAWQLADAGIRVDELATGQRELVTERLFFDEPFVDALEGQQSVPLTGVFTYFVNRIHSGEHSIPYSMVSAIGPLGDAAPSADPLLAFGAGLEDDELRLSAWAQEDMGLESGAAVELEFYRVDAARRMVVESASFRMAGAIEVIGTGLGRELMPDFPGLADAESCRDWEPGTPVDLKALRPADEAYWEDHGGTPKAFINLAAGRALWGSRFGSLSGARFTPQYEAELLANLRGALQPADLGLVLRDLRTPARRSSQSPTDFGGLFLGLSFFLIIAALLLTTQLFLFGVEARASEQGLLVALGFGRKRIRRLVLAEAGSLALLGSVLGAPLGLLFTQAVLKGLDTLWADAVARTPIEFHWQAMTLSIGVLSAWLSTLVAIAWGVRKALGSSVVELLAARLGVGISQESVSGKRSATWSVLLLSVAAAVSVLVDPSLGPAHAGAFFGAGAAVLTAGLLWVRWWLRRQTESRALRSGVSLGAANSRRRAGRSLGVAALVAIGAFMVLAVGANRLGPPSDPYARTSGTGGFALYGRTSLPLTADLDTAEGAEAFGFYDEDLEGVDFVRLRVRNGDDASCLNLSKPATPTLLGVDPAALGERGAFRFAKQIEPTDDEPLGAWSLLNLDLGPDVVPAIGDVTSLTWQLKLGLGDELDYVDERGRAMKVRIVAAISDTVLQGDLVIAERHFEERFPDHGGYRRMLVDVSAERAEEVSGLLTSGLVDVGLSVESSVARLDRFHGVQNTYLAIFQVLGALGLLLGSAGLGLVVLRNTQERRAELALMGALGFTRRRVLTVLGSEYSLLLGLGLSVGAAASLVAVIPLLQGEDPLGALRQVGLLIGALALHGLFWIGLVVWFVSREAPLSALREE